MNLSKASSVAVLLIAACNLAQAQTQNERSAMRGPKHCVIQTEAMRQGEIAPLYSGPAQTQCFGTFSEALHSATNGGIKVGQDFLPQSVTADMLAKSAIQPLATFVIGIEYEHAGFGGSSIIYNSSVSCAGFIHSVSYVGDDWNDRISSARAFSSCNHSVHFEHANFGGASVDCFTACNYIGDAMNDRTSSIRWFQ